MKDKIHESKTAINKIGIIYITAISMIGLYYGNERSLIFDGSWAVRAVSEYKLFITDNRFPNGINSILPFLGTILHLPLSSIVKLFSINYILTPILFYLILKYRQTSYKYEMAFLLGYSLFNYDTYIYATHSYWVGYYLIFILYRLIDDERFFKTPKNGKLYITATIVLIVFSHLVAIIGLVMLLTYFLISQKIKINSYIKWLILTSSIILIKYLFFSSGYESTFFSTGQYTTDQITQIYKSKLFNGLITSLSSTNINSLFVIGATSFLLLFKRPNILKFIYFILAINISILVPCVIFPAYDYSMYAEGYFKCSTVILPIIAVDTLWQSGLRYKSIPLSILFIFSVTILFTGGKKYKERYNMIASDTKKMTENLLIKTNVDICPTSILQLPLETMIINQIENKQWLYMAFEVKGNMMSTNILHELQNNNQYDNKRYLRFNQTTKEIYETELPFKIQYDKYACGYKYSCIDIVRTNLKDH